MEKQMYPSKREIEKRKAIIKKRIKALSEEKCQIEKALKRLYSEEWLLDVLSEFINSKEN